MEMEYDNGTFENAKIMFLSMALNRQSRRLYGSPQF